MKCCETCYFSGEKFQRTVTKEGSSDVVYTNGKFFESSSCGVGYGPPTKTTFTGPGVVCRRFPKEEDKWLNDWCGEYNDKDYYIKRYGKQ